MKKKNKLDQGRTRAETTIEVGEQNVSVKVGFESGAIARLTDGAVVADLGDTVVLYGRSLEKGHPSKTSYLYW